MGSHGLLGHSRSALIAFEVPGPGWPIAFQKVASDRLRDNYGGFQRRPAIAQAA